MNDSLFIVIPVHNRRQYTQDCLNSLSQQTRRDFKIIVIDDGSTDGTGKMIETEFPDVIVLRGDGNLWWTGATNLGVQYALERKAKHLITLNDDTIATQDFVEKMTSWAEREPKSLLGALALDHETRRPVYGGEVINWKLANYTKLLDVLKSDQQHGLQKVTHLPGRGLLIPAEVFEQIGFFDANHFPQGVADFDFTIRAIRAGYKAFCNYDAKLLVYPESVAGFHDRRKKSLKSYYNHLFGIKGSGNLINFFYYAVRNCPTHLLPLYLPIGWSRRIFGYLFEWCLELSKTQKHTRDV